MVLSIGGRPFRTRRDKICRTHQCHPSPAGTSLFSRLCFLAGSSVFSALSTIFRRTSLTRFHRSTMGHAEYASCTREPPTLAFAHPLRLVARPLIGPKPLHADHFGYARSAELRLAFKQITFFDTWAGPPHVERRLTIKTSPEACGGLLVNRHISTDAFSKTAQKPRPDRRIRCLEGECG